MTFKEFLKVKLEPSKGAGASRLDAPRRFARNFAWFMRSPAPKSDLIG